MTHIWLLMLLMIALSRAEHHMDPLKGFFGPERDRPHYVGDHEGLISGTQSGGPLGNQAGSGLVSGGDSGGPFGYKNMGLISGKGNGGPFVTNHNQDGIIYGSQSGGPLGNQAGSGLVSGGDSGRQWSVPFEHGNMGHNSEKDSERPIIGSGWLFGHKNNGLISGKGNGGPFVTNHNQGGTIYGSQSGGPLGNQAGSGLVSVGDSGGPFGHKINGLISGKGNGGPFVTNHDEDGITSGMGGKISGSPFSDEIIKLISVKKVMDLP